MPKIQYIEKRFGAKSLAVITQANVICREYAAQGFQLTLRQLYYQFVARGYIPNSQTEYKRLGDIINDARLTGYLDWDYIVDRTRNVRHHSSWDDPAAIIRSAAQGYALDLWEGQPNHVEVWIEKDALIGVIEPVCTRNQVDYFACRGYASQSEIWAAGQRFKAILEAERTPIVLYLGDHDPSGIDMPNDIFKRLAMFSREPNLWEEDGWGDDEERAVAVHRIALTMEQVRQYNPPPNPAKLTDSRADAYLRKFGESSWELDALSPTVIDALIQRYVNHYRDNDLWNMRVKEQETGRVLLTKASDSWGTIAESLAS